MITTKLISIDLHNSLQSLFQTFKQFIIHFGKSKMNYKLFFLVLSSGFIYAKTIIVEPNSKDKTLKIAFEQAEDGDTILVRSGHYKEAELHLNKAVTIIGENFPEIDGERKYENLTVESDNVTLIGLLFTNSGQSNFNDIAALKIKNSKNILIQNCRFKNNFFGIHTINSSYISYIGNDLFAEKIAGRASANGIHIWKSNHMTLKNNTIKGHRDGIYLEFVKNSHIENNHSINNSRYGMHFMFSHDNLFEKNEFNGNGAGVAVMYSKRVKMYHNVFAKSWGNAAYGLLLKEIDDSEIFQNSFENNTTAIYADGANRIIIKENNFSKNGWAMKINASSSDAVVDNNNFIANTFDLATNGSLVVKSLNGNYWDKYEGYDLNRDGIGDIPYRPITFYSIVIERNPGALMLFRSFFVKLMDKAENLIPSLTPENIKDTTPKMKKNKIILS